MKYVTQQVLSKASSITNQNQINWDDLNYPICLKLFHFDASETPEVHKRRVLLLRINHYLIIAATLLNLITNCIGTATGVPVGGLRVGISIFLLMFWLVGSLFMFIYPYQIIMKDQGSPLIFYIASLLTGLWFIIWSIADFADANGFVEVAENFSAQRSGAGFFGIVTALTMLGIGGLSFVNAYMFHKR